MERDGLKLAVIFPVWLLTHCNISGGESGVIFSHINYVRPPQHLDRKEIASTWYDPNQKFYCGMFFVVE